jgi:hypothetical protein
MAAIVLIAGFCYLEAIVIVFIKRVFRSALEMVVVVHAIGIGPWWGTTSCGFRIRSERDPTGGLGLLNEKAPNDVFFARVNALKEEPGDRRVSADQPLTVNPF